MEILLTFLKTRRRARPMKIPNPNVGSSAMRVPRAKPMAIEWGDVFSSITSWRCDFILFLNFFIICHRKLMGVVSFYRFVKFCC